MRLSRTAVSTSLRSLVDQRVDVELHVLEHLAHGIAFDHGVENDVARFVQLHVDGVGIAEQVVQVAQDLLIGAQQETRRDSTPGTR